MIHLPSTRRIFLPALLALWPFASASRAADPISIPPAYVPAAQVQMGVNLEQLCDYARSCMFIDTIKSARHFGSPDTPWDEKAPVDKDGWPTRDAGIVVMADVPVPPGDYAFSCTGMCTPALVNTPGTVTHIGYNRDKNLTSATITIDPASGATSFFLALKNTRNNGGGGVQNVRLLRPGYPRDTDQLFTRDFLTAIAPFSTLRFMDLLRTNQTDVADWKDRPHITDALQSTNRGIAWEYAIALANQSKKDLWINIPDRATDDYIRQLAQLFKDTLDPERAIYIEYSNEVWNSIFPQSGRNLAAAKAQVAAGDSKLNDGGKDANEYYWAWKRVPERLLEISAIFKQVFGPDAAAPTATPTGPRLRPVLASQSANPFMTRLQLEFIEKNYGPPAQFIYGIAGAPYLGPDDKIANGSNPSVDALLKAASENPWPRQVTTQYLVLARYYRVHHLCYEGGLAVEGEKNLPAKIAWNRDPRLAPIARDYFDMWYGQGGELFMYYNLCGPWGKFGAWGLTDDIRARPIKFKAALDQLAAPAPPLSIGFPVPGIIPAFKFDAHDGGGVENSPDGGQNLAFLRAGNTFDYLLNVAEPGTYGLTLQAAGDAQAQVQPSLSSIALPPVSPAANTDGKSWPSTSPILLKLDKGQLVLRLQITHPGLNIRSITFQRASS